MGKRATTLSLSCAAPWRRKMTFVGGAPTSLNNPGAPPFHAIRVGVNSIREPRAAPSPHPLLLSLRNPQWSCVAQPCADHRGTSTEVNKGIMVVRIARGAGMVLAIGMLTYALPAEARIVCRLFSSCKSAYQFCLARGNRAISASNCGSSLETCKATGIWYGYGARGLFQRKVRNM